jgi:pimeloyl-ACP methyl ester carboxylesterase
MQILGPTSNSFISQRLKLHYVDWGNPDAPPLILQHGGADHCRSWDWVAEELRHDWHVICPDLRGHGDSSWAPDGNYALNAMVYDFAQLVHTLGYDEVTIVAHSMGSLITSRYAGLYPEKVRRFVDVEGLGPDLDYMAKREPRPVADAFRGWIDTKRGAAGRAPKKYATLRDAYARMREVNSHLSEERARHLTIHGASRNEDGTWTWKFDPYIHVTWFNDLPRPMVEELWSQIACPVLMMHGTDSFARNPEQDGRIKHFKDARVVSFENAGHWLHHDQFDKFMAEIRAFL